MFKRLVQAVAGSVSADLRETAANLVNEVNITLYLNTFFKIEYYIIDMFKYKLH